MDSLMHESLAKMFNARRLSPWVAEHSKFIDAQLAMLDILEPKDAVTFREFYQKQMDTYVAEHPEEFAHEEVTEVVEPVVEVKVVTEEPKKRGKKSKNV